MQYRDILYYICTHTHTHTYIYIYMYIWREREREREREYYRQRESSETPRWKGVYKSVAKGPLAERCKLQEIRPLAVLLKRQVGSAQLQPILRASCCLEAAAVDKEGTKQLSNVRQSIQYWCRSLVSRRILQDVVAARLTLPFGTTWRAFGTKNTTTPASVKYAGVAWYGTSNGTCRSQCPNSKHCRRTRSGLGPAPVFSWAKYSGRRKPPYTGLMVAAFG